MSNLSTLDTGRLSHTLTEFNALYGNKTQKCAVVELMNQTNDILDDIGWIESNDYKGHTTTIRTGLPVPDYRRIYRGTENSKSQVSQITDTCSMIESRSEVDEVLFKSYGSKKAAYRTSEDGAHLEGMRQKVAEDLFYSNNDINPDGIRGLSLRYSSPSENSRVIDAGGTGNNLTSIWIIGWGDNSVHGIYPKDSTMGIDYEDLGRQTVLDEKGRQYEAMVSRFQWQFGISVRDWRSVVRICNISVKDMDSTIQSLLIKAKNLIPANLRQKAIWYMNEDVKTALEIQAVNSKNVHLTYGQFFNSNEVMALFGRPVRQCDVLLSTESKLS